MAIATYDFIIFVLRKLGEAYMMGQSNRRTSTTTKEHARLTGPRIIFGWERVAMRARIDMTSKPDVEYTGKHGGGGMLSPTLVVRDNNC